MPSLADLVKRQNIGYSPDQRADVASQHGGAQNLLSDVLAARYHEQGAPADLTALTPEDRASLDRYSNFARLAKASSNPLEAAVNYLGGMGLMGVTEGLKFAQPVQQAASTVYNMATGGNKPFFGGQDTSSPSLANLVAAHYGFMAGRK